MRTRELRDVRDVSRESTSTRSEKRSENRGIRAASLAVGIHSAPKIVVITIMTKYQTISH